MLLSRKIDLTDDRAFSTRRLPKKISLSPLPWYDATEEYKFKVAAWFKGRFADSCERCGADTRTLPWDTELPTLCRKCAGLLVEPESLWTVAHPKDAYNTVFLSEFATVNRNR